MIVIFSLQGLGPLVPSRMYRLPSLVSIDAGVKVQHRVLVLPTAGRLKY